MNKKRSHLVLIIAGFLSIFLLFACSGSQKTEDLEIDFGYDYYPLSIGKSWTYQVDSVIFRSGISQVIKDTTRLFLREVVVDTTTSLTGELQYIIERYQRPNYESPWQISKVFSRSRSKDRAFLTEDNLRFVVMPFPVETGKRWDGHAFFDITRLFPIGGEFVAIYDFWEDYMVSEMNKTVEIDGQSFQDVISIQQANYQESALNDRVAQEKYARDVGLIYREWFIADSQCEYCCDKSISNCLATPLEERAEKGFYLRQVLIEYN